MKWLIWGTLLGGLGAYWECGTNSVCWPGSWGSWAIGGAPVAGAPLKGVLKAGAKVGLREPTRRVMVWKGHTVMAVRGMDHLPDAYLWKMLRNGSGMKDKTGKVLDLHHLGRQRGKVVMIPSRLHTMANKTQHPAGAVLGKVERKKFRAWKKTFWRQRARDELKVRGLLL